MAEVAKRLSGSQAPQLELLTAIQVEDDAMEKQSRALGELA